MTTQSVPPATQPAASASGWSLLRETRRALVTLLYVAPLAPILDLAGYAPPYVRLLAVWGLMGAALCLARRARVVRGILALAMGMAIVAVLGPPPVSELCVLLLVHQYVWSLVPGTRRRTSVAIAAYALVHVVLFLSPLGSGVLETLTQGISQLAAWVARGPVALGHTYLGTGALLLFATLSVSGWDRSWVSKGRTAALLLVALLVNGFLAAVLLTSVDRGAEMVWSLPYRDVFGPAEVVDHVGRLGVLVFPALVFLAQAIAFVVLHPDAREPGADHEEAHGAGGATVVRSPRWRTAALTATALALVLLAVPPTAWRRPKTSKLLLVERGVVSFSRPDYERLGQAAASMYGMLPDYARLFGCDAEVVDDIPEVLEPDQVLVLTNLDEPLEPAVHDRIWDWVRGGGRLWVLGDHTFIKNGRNHVNDLLAPCHIRLRHDSAQFFPQGWFNSYRFRQGTPFGSLRDDAENRPAILVGASLQLEAPARPFIVGTYGYSDLGPTTPLPDREYLGDFVHQRHERLGDLVLVAGERVGDGKVLVFGDTTSFFTNNLPRSNEILQAVLSWFGEAPVWGSLHGSAAEVGAGVLLLAFLILMVLWGSPAAACTLLVAVGAVSFVGHRPSGLLPFDKSTTRRRMVVLDESHEPFVSKNSSMDGGLHGLVLNLMRYGLLPVSRSEWDEGVLDASALVVLNAPRRSFSAGDRDDLMQFMRRGGVVLLTCGYEHYAYSRSLLEPLGLAVDGVPLGRFFDRQAFGDRVSFFSAWPLVIRGEDVEVLCVYDDSPLIASVGVGAGRVVLIGDSHFLRNQNLESMRHHDAANIRFVRSLLDHVLGPRE